jgi:hypothetical protein
MDLVGIFVAPSLLALALPVDECVDPGVCACQRMRSGGIMWTCPAVVVPLVFDDDDEDLAGHEDPDHARPILEIASTGRVSANFSWPPAKERRSYRRCHRAG